MDTIKSYQPEAGQPLAGKKTTILTKKIKILNPALTRHQKSRY